MNDRAKTDIAFSLGALVVVVVTCVVIVLRSSEPLKVKKVCIDNVTYLYLVSEQVLTPQLDINKNLVRCVK